MLKKVCLPTTCKTRSISRYNFWHAPYLLNRDGNRKVQLELFPDLGTNVSQYLNCQALFHEHQPPAFLTWDRSNQIFPIEIAYPYRRDLNDIEFHLLDTSNFALVEFGPLIVIRMSNFLDRVHSLSN